MNFRLKALPAILIFYRLFAGFALVILAYYSVSGKLLTFILSLGFLSDVADGMLMRRLGVDSLAFRRMDTRADILFYGGATIAAFQVMPSLFTLSFPWMVGYLLLFLLRNVIDFVRYRESPSYHMWSGKVWSCLVFAILVCAYFSMFSFYLMAMCFALYLINTMEGVFASVILTHPSKDLATAWHAWVKMKDDKHEGRTNNS